MVREKRSMERYDLDLPAILTFENGAGKIAHQKVVTKNVCAGGSFCTKGPTLPRGTDVKMELILSLEKYNNFDVRTSHISVSGKVLRSNEKGLAVCFNQQYQIMAVA
jgi:hypothetical protein